MNRQRYAALCDQATDPEIVKAAEAEAGHAFTADQLETVFKAFSRIKEKILDGSLSDSVIVTLFPGLE